MRLDVTSAVEAVVSVNLWFEHVIDAYLLACAQGRDWHEAVAEAEAEKAAGNGSRRVLTQKGLRSKGLTYSRQHIGRKFRPAPFPHLSSFPTSSTRKSFPHPSRAPRRDGWSKTQRQDGSGGRANPPGMRTERTLPAQDIARIRFPRGSHTHARDDATATCAPRNCKPAPNWLRLTRAIPPSRANRDGSVCRPRISG